VGVYSKPSLRSTGTKEALAHPKHDCCQKCLTDTDGCPQTWMLPKYNLFIERSGVGSIVIFTVAAVAAIVGWCRWRFIYVEIK
jgi:hypothetical protein